jgi:hypothetical protein
VSVRHPSDLDPTPAQIACPVCGSATWVAETRKIANGLRRRRHCRDDACLGRLTTLEIPAPDVRRWGGKRMVLVPVDELDTIAALIESLRPKDDQ